MIKKEIRRVHPEEENVNSILIDFYLYDTIKKLEKRRVSRLDRDMMMLDVVGGGDDDDDDDNNKDEREEGREGEEEWMPHHRTRSIWY